MPAPITHLAYGQKYLDSCSRIDGQAFLRGTIFPDIRYLAGFDRSKTHRPFEVSLDEIAEEVNSWRSGFLFHNWVDDEWNRYFVRYGLDYDDPSQTPAWSALKILEERSILGRIEDRAGLARSLEFADREAVEFGVRSEAVERWGWYVGARVVGSWMDEGWEQFARQALGQTDDGVAEWRRQLARLESEGVWEDRLQGCWDEIASKIEASYEANRR